MSDQTRKNTGFVETRGIGNLAADAELVAPRTEGGKMRVKARVICAAGQDVEGVNLVIWDNLAVALHPYLVKGKQVYFEGMPRTRSYEQNGETKYFTETHVTRIVLLGGGPRAAEYAEEEYAEYAESA